MPLARNIYCVLSIESHRGAPRASRQLAMFATAALCAWIRTFPRLMSVLGVLGFTCLLRMQRLSCRSISCSYIDPCVRPGKLPKRKLPNWGPRTMHTGPSSAVDLSETSTISAQLDGSIFCIIKLTFSVK